MIRSLTAETLDAPHIISSPYQIYNLFILVVRLLEHYAFGGKILLHVQFTCSSTKGNDIVQLCELEKHLRGRDVQLMGKRSGERVCQ